MKRMVWLATVLALLLTGCNVTGGAPAPSGGESAQGENRPVALISNIPGNLPPKEVGVGDRYLDWTVTRLEVEPADGDDESIAHGVITFAGQCTLRGTIFHARRPDSDEQVFAFVLEQEDYPLLPNWVDLYGVSPHGIEIVNAEEFLTAAEQAGLADGARVLVALTATEFEVERTGDDFVNRVVVEQMKLDEISLPVSNLSGDLPSINLRVGDTLLGWTVRKLAGNLVEGYYDLTVSGSQWIEGRLEHHRYEPMEHVYFFTVTDSSADKMLGTFAPDGNTVEPFFILNETPGSSVFEDLTLDYDEIVYCKIRVTQCQFLAEGRMGWSSLEFDAIEVLEPKD